MRIKQFPPAAFYILCLVIPGCRQPVASSANDTGPDSTLTVVPPDSGYLVCAGIFELPRSAKVAVTAPASGTVKQILSSGSYTKAGTPLFILEDIAFLKLQQEYLESRHQLGYFSQELKRQGELALEKAASLKKLQETELEYKIWETRKTSLEKQLALLGINADSLESENLTSTITVTAAVSGFFESQVLTGAYIGPEIVLATLRIKTEVLLYAEIPEDLYASIHLHQNLSYSLPGRQQTHTATIVSIERKVNPVTHCFRIRIKPGTDHEPAIPGMQAKIYVPRGNAANDNENH